MQSTPALPDGLLQTFKPSETHGFQHSHSDNTGLGFKVYGGFSAIPSSAAVGQICHLSVENEAGGREFQVGLGFRGLGFRGLRV